MDNHKKLKAFHIRLDRNEDKDLIDFIDLQDAGRKSSAIKVLLRLGLAQVGLVKINHKFISQLIENNSKLLNNSEINSHKCVEKSPINNHSTIRQLVKAKIKHINK